MLFLFGTDCNSNAIFVLFPGIFYQSRMDCKWCGFLIPFIKTLPFNKFTLYIYPLFNDLTSLKRKHSKTKQGLRERGVKKKGCNHNLFKNPDLKKALSYFSFQVKPIHKEVIEVYMAGERKNPLAVLCIRVSPCLSDSLRQFANMLTSSQTLFH